MDSGAGAGGRGYRSHRRTDNACRVGELRRDDLGVQLQQRQEAVRVLRYAAADNDQIRAEQGLDMREVLLYALGPLLPAQLLLVAHPSRGAPLRVLTAYLQVPELRVRHEQPVHEQRRT